MSRFIPSASESLIGDGLFICSSDASPVALFATCISIPSCSDMRTLWRRRSWRSSCSTRLWKSSCLTQVICRSPSSLIQTSGHMPRSASNPVLALCSTRAFWVPVLRGVFRSLRAILRRQQPVPAVNPHGGRLGRPADVLIASDGRVLACKYGAHVYDQWTIDEILALVGLEDATHRAQTRKSASRGM